MMKRLLTPLIFAAVLLGATSAHAVAASQAAVFNPTCVSKIHLSASDQAIANLYAAPKGDYQPATMTFDVCGAGTEIHGPVAVTFRLKGSGSFQTLDGKAAFKIKMPSASRIDGLKSLTLNNMTQDQSSVHEALVYHAFRSVGVKAPRTGYATVRINDTDYGLHSNVESLDDRFAAANFASMQHLYEQPDWTEGWNQTSQRDILPANVPNFQIQEGSSSSRSDLESAAATWSNANDADWWAAFQQKFAVENVMKFWATEFYTGDQDNYVNYVNNFYLHSTTGGVFSFIPWGTDMSFRDSVPLFGYSSASQVVTRCLNYAPCRTAYRTALGQVAENIIALDLVGEAHQLHAAIANAVASDPRSPYSADEQCEGVNDTIDFLIAREALWSSAFRSPGSGITSAQSSEYVQCATDPTGPTVDPTGPTGPTVPSDPTGETAPSDPSPTPDASPSPTQLDAIAPRLKSVSARRLFVEGLRAHARGSRTKLDYRLTIVASDVGTGIDTLQVRTIGKRIRSIRIGGDSSYADLSTAAKQIRVRVLDRAGNASKWKTLTLRH